MSKTPPETIERIVALARNGYTAAQIEVETGCKHTTINKYVRAAGVRARRGNETHPDTQDRIIELARAQMPRHEICKLLGVSDKAVKRIADNAGVKPPRSIDQQGIVRMILEGANNRAIATAMETTPRSVQRIRAMIQTPEDRGLPPRSFQVWDDAEIETMRWMLLEGYPLREIGDTLGRGMHAVRSKMNDLNLPRTMPGAISVRHRRLAKSLGL